MSNVTVIPKIDVPAEILQQFSALTGVDDLDAGVSVGFPVMSIKGTKWRIIEGGEEKPIYLPGTRDLAPFVKVVIMKANSAISKVFYAGQFVEGSDAPPDCYSNDGIQPAADSVHPQCATCAQCPQNVWGSKISPSGAKIKACGDVRRIAILPAEDLSYSPILLRVPGASLSDLAAYGKLLRSRKIPYAAVVTKLSFDPDAAFPKILFQFDRVLTAEEMATVASRIDEPVVDDILGLTVRGSAPAPAPEKENKFGIPADIQAPAVPSAPATQMTDGSNGAGTATSSAGADEGTDQSATASAQAAAAATPPARKSAKSKAKAEPAPEVPEQAPDAGDADALASEMDAALAALNL